jgi:hypothetical protein
MNAKETLTEAIHEFGQPSRDVGSGLSIPEWDIAGGVLRVHPLGGPTFRLPNGKIIWLIRTTNLAGDNLHQDFEMTTLPDLANHGTRFWIGDVHITHDGTYHYVDSGSNPYERSDQSSNFFLHYPNGHVEIIWLGGISAASRLETLGDNQIAVLRFIAKDGKTKLESRVVSSDQTRMLSIVGPTFEMEQSWLQFWLR